MKNIFRCPVDNQHFKDTVESGKSLLEIRKFVSEKEFNELKKCSSEGVLRYWGSMPGDSSCRFFDKMQPGDELLCYRRGQYISAARIGRKLINKELAKYSWGETEIGKTWELMYFLTDVKFFEIDSKIANKELGYLEGPVMGFSAMSSEKLKNFYGKYSSVYEMISTLEHEEKIPKLIQKELVNVELKSPYEAQYYLVELGNMWEFNTYVPPNDGGRSVSIGKKLCELVTVTKEELRECVAPRIFNPLSNIDVIWFKESFKPRYFFEVIRRSGMKEAFMRLETMANNYEGSASYKIIGGKEIENDFNRTKRLYYPDAKNVTYKTFDGLFKTFVESQRFGQIKEEFLS